MKERQPLRGRWDRVRSDPRPLLAVHGCLVVEHFSAWRLGKVLALSSWQMAEAPDNPAETVPHWLVSVSENGGRPSDRSTQRVRIDFALEGALEDNHHPGIARHLWMPEDPARRGQCHCQTDETVVTEPDGYQWSQDPKRCRGCELEPLTGRACPIPPRRVSAGGEVDRCSP